MLPRRRLSGLCSDCRPEVVSGAPLKNADGTVSRATSFQFRKKRHTQLDVLRGDPAPPNISPNAARLSHAVTDCTLDILLKLCIGTHPIGVENRTDMLDVKCKVIRRLGKHDPPLLPRVCKTGFIVDVWILTRKIDDDQVSLRNLAPYLIYGGSRHNTSSARMQVISFASTTFLITR